VHASGVNPTDYKARAGMTPRPIDDFQIPHHDGAGVIEAVGPGVDPGRAGERVWLWLAAAGSRWGTAAEWSVVPERQATPLPERASFELGASPMARWPARRFWWPEVQVPWGTSPLNWPNGPGLVWSPP
jgi:NADPH2:quinone reductase